MEALPVPFETQRRRDWCLPACAAMVLAYHGHPRPQAELASLMRMLVDGGTYPESAAAALQSYGLGTTVFQPRLYETLANEAIAAKSVRRLVRFGGSALPRPLTYKAIEHALADGCPVIAIGRWNRSKRMTHAVLVVGLSARNVVYHDPHGRLGGANCTLSRKEFTSIARRGGRIGIVTSRPSWSLAR